MNKKFGIKILSMLLVLLSTLSIFIMIVSATDESETKPLDGLKISILGDSISTFTNISSGSAAQTTNSTIANNRVFYGEGTNGVQLNDTWWMQVMDKLGGELLVNNSFSRSTVFDPNDDKNIQGYYERCVNLHDNTGDNAGEEPDIIIVYMGINDFSYCRETLGLYEDIDFKTLINGTTYSEPTTTCEAYAIMLNKITNRYPDAEVYCFTLPAKKNFVGNEEAVYIRYNSSLKKLADHFDCISVDTYHDSGIIPDKKTNEMYLSDGVHPNKNGMTAIANAFINTFYNNSRYIDENDNFYTVDYVLSEAIVDNGKITRVPDGSFFKCTLSAVYSNPLNIIVLSNGVDISDSVVFDDNTVYIPEVTTDITIIASPVIYSENHNYCYTKELFLNGNYNILNIADNQFTENELTPVFCNNETDYYYRLNKTIALRYTEPWSIVWTTNYENNSKPISFYNYSDNTRENNTYIKYDPESTLLSIGIYKHGNFCDYGVKLCDYGIDASTDHSYRLTNVLEGTSNTIYLYVDGRKVAPIIECYVNSEKYEEDYNRWNGRDLFINYIGCDDYGVDLSVAYNIEVWENYNSKNHEHIFLYEQFYEGNCIEDKRTEHVCICGYAEVDIVRPATGHSPSEQIITAEPTETTEGTAIIKCTVCGEVLETVVIAKTIVPIYVKVLLFICVLIIPLIMIVIGIIYTKKKKLSKPNAFVGYRTSLSMKNEDTWLYANKLMGKVFLIFGLIILVSSSLIMIPFINKTESVINTAVTVITLVQTVLIALSAIPVEVKLRKTFDKDGKRID